MVTRGRCVNHFLQDVAIGEKSDSSSVKPYRQVVKYVIFESHDTITFM